MRGAAGASYVKSQWLIEFETTRSTCDFVFRTTRFMVSFRFQITRFGWLYTNLMTRIGGQEYNSERHPDSSQNQIETTSSASEVLKCDKDVRPDTLDRRDVLCWSTR